MDVFTRADDTAKTNKPEEEKKEQTKQNEKTARGQMEGMQNGT